MKILVTGGRDYADAERVFTVLDEYYDEDSVLLHGDAKGADTLAKEAAQQIGFEVQAFPADWGKHGKAAGVIRNQEMVNENPDILIAFPGGKGTANCVKLASDAGIPIRYADGS